MPAPPPNAYTPGTVLTVGSHEATIGKYVSEGGFAHVYTCSTKPALPGGIVGCLKRVAVPDKVYLALLRAEVDAMQRLRGKSNVVQYFDSHAERSKTGHGYEVFLLMEYCSGGGLIDYMNARLRTQLTETEVLKIMFDTTLGLAHMHYLQPPLIHRDLKIENVLLTGDGDWKLCDFGSVSPVLRPPENAAEARVLEDDIVHHTTAQYRSPEMIDVTRGFPIDEKSDIWALGVFLYKLCFYTTPFEQGGNAAILSAQYIMPQRPAYSPRLRNMIRVLLQLQPQQRPTVYQVLQELAAMRGVECPIQDKWARAAEQRLQQPPQQPLVQVHAPVSTDLLRVRSREGPPMPARPEQVPPPLIVTSQNTSPMMQPVIGVASPVMGYSSPAMLPITRPVSPGMLPLPQSQLPCPVSPSGRSDISESEIAARFPTLDDFELDALNIDPLVPLNGAPIVPNPAGKPSSALLRVNRISTHGLPQQLPQQIPQQMPQQAAQAALPQSTLPQSTLPKPALPKPALPKPVLARKLGQILTGLDAKSSTIVIEAPSGHIDSNVDFLRQLRDQNTGSNANPNHSHPHGSHASTQRRSSWFGGRKGSVKHSRQASISSIRTASAGRRASLDVIHFGAIDSEDDESDKRPYSSNNGNLGLDAGLEDYSDGSKSIRSVESAPAFDSPLVVSPQSSPDLNAGNSNPGKKDARWRSSFKPSNSIQQRVHAFLQGQEQPARRTAKGYGKYTDGDSNSLSSFRSSSSRASPGSDGSYGGETGRNSTDNGLESIMNRYNGSNVSLNAAMNSANNSSTDNLSEARQRPVLPSRRLKPALGRIS